MRYVCTEAPWGEQAPLVATLTDEPEDYLKAAAAWSIGQAR